MSSAAHALPHDDQDDSHEQPPRLQVFDGTDGDQAESGQVLDEVFAQPNTVRGPWADQDETGRVASEHPESIDQIDSRAAFEEAAARAFVQPSGDSAAPQRRRRSQQPIRKRQAKRPDLKVVHPPQEFDENEFVRQAGALAELLQSKLQVDEAELRESVKTEWSGLRESHEKLANEKHSLSAELQQQQFRADEEQRKQTLLAQQMQAAWDTERQRLEDEHNQQLHEQRDEFELLLRQQQRRLEGNDHLR